jgi:colanic acid biosynthesis glycosyl transferase WcaI
VNKILIIGLNFFPETTGAGRYTTEMAVHLSDKGSAVRVITAHPYYPGWRIQSNSRAWQYRFEEWRGIQIFRSPLWVPKKPSRLNRLPHLLSFVLSCFPVALMQVIWKPDLVLCVLPTLFSAPVALLVARLSGARSWLHIQDFEIDAAFNLGILPGRRHLNKLVQSLERLLLTHFDRVSTITERMLALAANKGVPADRLSLAPNWVDTKQIYPLSGNNPLRAELGIADDNRVVLYHGNMGYKQGLEIILDVAAQLRDQSNILFLICGEGPLRAELEEKAQGCSNVRVSGLQPEEKLNQLANLADVHILPQRADAADLVMPSKLTTMLASGKPVVACADPGTQLWNVVKDVGIPVKPEDAHPLAAAILALIKDPSESARLGRLGRAYATKYLEKEQLLENFRQALDDELLPT